MDLKYDTLFGLLREGLLQLKINTVVLNDLDFVELGIQFMTTMLPKYDPIKARYNTYVAAITSYAYNRYIRIKKQQKQQKNALKIHKQSIISTLSKNPNNIKYTIEDVRNAISTLSHESQHIIEQHYYHNRSMKDIANEIGLSRMQVDYRIRIALSKIRFILERKHD